MKLSERLAAVPRRQLSSMTVPFGEWMPDQPDLGNPGAITAKNVWPAQQSYRPVPSLVAQSTNGLDGTALGGISARDASNNVFVYAGDATKLYELLDLTFNDESKAGNYTTGVDDIWEFEVFNNQVIATNFTDPVQFITIGGGASGLFADLITSTNKPKAKHLAVVRDFLVLGNTSDATDGHVPNRTWWSAIRDSADFDPDATTQSDFYDFLEGGWVQRVVGGAEYGVVFQDRQISRMTYVGPPAIFDFFPVDRKRGTPIPGSVVPLGRLIFYISEEGFFAFDGSQSIPIGAEKVDREFWNQFDINNKRNLTAAIDPVNKLVIWCFPGEGSTGGMPNKCFFYNWQVRKWSEAELDVQIILRAATQGFTLETLDTISTDIDTLTPSLDADLWKGGQVRLAAFDTNNTLSFANGPSLAPTIDTPEVQLFKGQRALVTSVRPLVQGSSVPSIQIAGRETQNDPVVFDTAAAINSIGECNVRNNARFHRARLTVPAGATWDHAIGIDIPSDGVAPAGRK